MDKSYYPGTATLVNKFDIRDPDIVKSLEFKFSAARELDMRASPVEGTFDSAYLKAIHRHVFIDMYDWAGKPREIDFERRSKQTGLANKFAPAAEIEAKAAEIDKIIADKNQLKGLTKPEFLKAFTDIHTKLNELHPFREGNERVSRIFLTQLARNAGYDFDLTKIDKERLHVSSHKALDQYDPKNPGNKLVGNQSEIRQVFFEALTPTLAHAFDVESREAALKSHPDLKPAYERLDTLKQQTEAMKPEIAQRLLDAEKTRISKKLHTLDQKDDSNRHAASSGQHDSSNSNDLSFRSIADEKEPEQEENNSFSMR